MSAALKYWPLVATALNIFLAWMCWSLRQVAKTEAKAMVDGLRIELSRIDDEAEAVLDDHQARITRTEKDVEAIRQDIAKLPTKADLAEVRGEVKSVGNQVQSLDRGIARLEGYFLQLGVEKAS